MLPLISLDIRIRRGTPCDDACDYYNRFEYDAFLDGDDGKETLIAKGASVLYLMEKASDDGFDIIDAFDDNHHEDIYDLLFDGDVLEGTEGLKEEWEDITVDCFNMNILVSDRLEILPAYQHKGYGAVIRQILRDFFSGCYCLEVLKSFPLQLETFDNAEGWRSQMQYDKMSKDDQTVQASLNRCYLRDGYTQYKDTNYFYRTPSDPSTLNEDMYEEDDEDEYADIDFSQYEESFDSKITRKKFKQIDPVTFIPIGEATLEKKDDRKAKLVVNLENLYKHHPDLFQPFERYRFDLSPIGLAKEVKYLHPSFSDGISFDCFGRSQNEYVCFLFEILETLGFKYGWYPDSNKSYTFGRDNWSKAQLADLKKKDILVFRLLNYGTACCVDVYLSKEEARARGINKQNLCDARYA